MALASGSEQFRVPKTSSQETGLVNDTVPPSTKYKNKWAVNTFAKWQSLREVKVPVLDCGGVFKDYELSPSTSVVSTSTCTTIEKREEQDESIALKDVVLQKGNLNNCAINVIVFKEARKGFFGCYSVCEMMKDTKEGYFIM